MTTIEILLSQTETGGAFVLTHTSGAGKHFILGSTGGSRFGKTSILINMETKNASCTAVLEVLDKSNYVDWNVRVKTYLMANDLWDVIEQPEEEPQASHHVASKASQRAASKAMSKRNALALHVIHISCGPDAFSEIRDTSSAQQAWNELAEKYNTPEIIQSVTNKIEDDADKVYKAVRSGHWNVAEEFLSNRHNEVITHKGQTALHVAVVARHMHIVEKLIELMTEKELEIRDNDGYTALMSAVVRGNHRIAECMLRKNPNLISVGFLGGNIPVVIAIDFGEIETARFLYPLTPLEYLKPETDHNGATLFTRAIYTGTLDIALDLIQRCPRLVLSLDSDGKSPILALASMSSAFPSGNKLVLWKRWIYSRIHVQLAHTSKETCLNISTIGEPKSDKVKTEASVPGLWCLSQVYNFLGIQDIYKAKLIHTQSLKLLSLICEEISKSNPKQREDGRFYSAINLAVKNGIFEFVSKILSTDPELLWNKDRKSRNIFSLSVLHRQAKIFSLILPLDLKNALTSCGDDDDNSMLHMAGMIENSNMLDHIPGAALQMQRELHWFKEVEQIVHPKVKEATNKDGLTPRQLCTKNHENMLQKGEQWMKDTATSCTVVGALIITIMFAAVFTVPGGNNQETGYPLFLSRKIFLIFVISDALSLFSASTSVLMFLGILTSRYTEEDFLEPLPRKMIIGLSTLFFSIAAMMIAFCAALLIILHGKTWIVVPVICLSSVPVTLFAQLQFPLLVQMTRSTYGTGILDRKIKLEWINS